MTRETFDSAMKDLASESKKIYGPKLKEVLLFAPIVQSYDTFNYWLEVTPFYKNVRNEGVQYA